MGMGRERDVCVRTRITCGVLLIISLISPYHFFLINLHPKETHTHPPPPYFTERGVGWVSVMRVPISDDNRDF